MRAFSNVLRYEAALSGLSSLPSACVDSENRFPMSAATLWSFSGST